MRDDSAPAAPAAETGGSEAPSSDKAGQAAPQAPRSDKPRPVEIGGRKGPDPTRYGDWEKDGRAIDF